MSGKAMGPAGQQGKGSGSGAMTDTQDELVGENDVLSDRDKSQHTDARGLDSKGVQIDLGQDTATNRKN